MLSRPSDSGHTPFGDIFLSESKDLEYWGHHRHVMGKSGRWWENVKIGGGAKVSVQSKTNTLKLPTDLIFRSEYMKMRNVKAQGRQ